MAPIRALDVHKTFHSGEEEVCALDGLSLEVPERTFLCVMGASGSGKSTLLKVLAGLERPTRGRVEILGRDLHGMDEGQLADMRLKDVGMIHQDNLLVPDMTLLDNTALPLLLAKVPAAAARSQAAIALGRVGIGTLATRYPDEVSGGQAQRCGVARALCGAKRVLLADEPTGALDSKRSLEIFGLFRDLARDGMTIVLCTHDPRASDFAGRNAVMTDGRLAALR